MVMEFKPPFTAPGALVATLENDGFAVLSSEAVAALSGAPLGALRALESSWEELPRDDYLRDAGRYRRRRHGSFVIDAGVVQQVAHRAHFQPPEYNALHGGLTRWFAPLSEPLVAAPAWSQLLAGFAAVFSKARGVQRFYVEAHQFRIDTDEGIGRPTPEGAHRDGVDFVVLLLIKRVSVRGGETRVFAADAPTGQRFTLTEPWSALVLDDARVVHESTPIQPMVSADLTPGYRDTLVLTYRKDGFQEPE